MIIYTKDQIGRAMNEPKNIRDLKWMRETSNGWTGGTIETKKYETYVPLEVGMKDHYEIRVGFYCGLSRIVVEKIDHIVKEIKSESSRSLIGEQIWGISYSFDEFKKSEWWEKCMKAWSGGMTDTSWIDDCEYTNDDNYININCNVSSTYKDWLNNNRQDHKVHGMNIFVEKSSGYIELTYDAKTIGFTFSELKDMLNKQKLMEENHVFIDEDGIKIRFDEKGE